MEKVVRNGIILLLSMALIVSCISFFQVITVYANHELDIPELKGIKKDTQETPVKTYIIGTDEKDSPYDRIQTSQIHIFKNKVTIDINDAYISAFSDTNSMDPVIDKEATAIQIVPKSIDEIHVGDIISFQTDFSENRIIHRVVEIDYDEEGWYARTKGDNVASIDPYKVRFSQIKRVLIGIIY